MSNENTKHVRKYIPGELGIEGFWVEYIITQESDKPTYNGCEVTKEVVVQGDTYCANLANATNWWDL